MVSRNSHRLPPVIDKTLRDRLSALTFHFYFCLPLVFSCTFPDSLIRKRPLSDPYSMVGPHQTQNRAGSGTATPNASATQTSTGSRPNLPSQVTLRLRGEEDPAREPPRRIRWAEDVVNNEGMGKKKSKVCCIYHKPRAVGESSDESSDSSSDSDSESDNDDGAARPSNPRGRQGKHSDHSHDGCGHAHDAAKRHSKKPRKPSPNAYEKQPKYKPKPGPQA